MIVPFDDHEALAEAVNDLLDDPERLERVRRRAREVGNEMSWPQVGRQTAEVLREAIALGPPATVRRPPPAVLPRARTSHLLTLVDDVGIIQHADGIIPTRSSGYCVDDVARLAIVALGLRQTAGTEEYNRMLALSLAFLRHAWDSDRGGMHNFLSYDRRWLDEPHGGDHLGRAAWALGEVVGAQPPAALLEPSRILLLEMLPALGRQRSPRHGLRDLGLTMPVGAPGEEATAWWWATWPGGGRAAARQRLARLVLGRGLLAYDNARPSSGLIAAGAGLGDDRLLSEGLRSLDWYLAEVGIDTPFSRHVGHNNRARGPAHPGYGDEQPLNAAALAEAQVEAFLATGSDAAALAPCGPSSGSWAATGSTRRVMTSPRRLPRRIG